ncbi:thiolase family protein [Helicobacter felis]|uniref:Acetyl-CoA acetyltransferase 2 n=1 Tax=Helicobacter felis (strain ATCC 49179 / CCUG 28539 / NCTC 12436 / CS1) TaxID=936155 RepID=E7AAE9_HELFC|nr:thiolase family protein [Helicobacter felis]CBY82671.1 acetyl-CoA acetyltransferase 2 [Helicobacter felis ATCC 49179]
MKNLHEVYVYSAKRSPIGSFNGSLSSVPATTLGSVVGVEALKASGFDSGLVDTCIVGNVISAGLKQAPARQVALNAHLPNSVGCFLINEACGSGLRAVMLGASEIALGRSRVALVGGIENMSLAPHLLMGSRGGFKMGDAKLEDSLFKDGLRDAYQYALMGDFAEGCAKNHRLSREEQDHFAKHSYEKALEAIKTQAFDSEIVPISIKSKKGEELVSLDEEPSKVNFEKGLKLKPAFDKEGTITAFNASKISDGASMLVIASKELAKDTSTKPLAKILDYNSFSHDPHLFPTAPAPAIQKLLERNHKKVSDIDLYEISEAFAVVGLLTQRELELKDTQINVHGGAIALGHPIGASGARILTTLVHALHRHDKHLGVACLCVGGGEAVAMLIERL